MREASRRRRARLRLRFDAEFRAREVERVQRYRETIAANRENDRLRQFRTRHDVEPCYVTGCKHEEHEHGLCARHLFERAGAPFVDGYVLGDLLRTWVTQWEAEHEKPPAELIVGGVRPGDPSLSALEVIVERTHRRGGLPVPRRALEPILRGERERVEFYELADPLVCAIGQTDVFRNGQLEVFGESTPMQEVAA